jgi:hypothetical protein
MNADGKVMELSASICVHLRPEMRFFRIVAARFRAAPPKKGAQMGATSPVC